MEYLIMVLENGLSLIKNKWSKIHKKIRVTGLVSVGSPKSSRATSIVATRAKSKTEIK